MRVDGVLQGRLFHLGNMMAALGVELIGHVVGQLSESAPTSLTGRRQASMQQRPVNEIVSWSMAKKRQMRWSDEGAHLLAQVRVHELNGELRPRQIPFPLRPPKPPHDPKWDAYLMLKAA